jgi:GT2 family glycosyltransferase
MTPQRFATTISLVTYNGLRWLPYCLESLLKSTDQDFFLMVVDNGSIDGSADLVERYVAERPELKGRFRLVRNKKNLGFARGHNQALAWTQSDYVLLLNQDVVLASTYLEATRRALDEHPLVAAVSGKLLRWRFDPATFHLNDLEHAETQASIDSVGLTLHRSRRVTNQGFGEADTGQYNKGHEVFGVTGTAPLYRRQALEAVSLDHQIFDELFVSYKEDVDLAWRLQLAGYAAWYLPEALAYHDRSLAGAESGWSWQLVRQHRRFPRELKVYSWTNYWAVLIKNDGVINIIRDLPWIIGYQLKVMAYLLVFEPLTLWRVIVRTLSLAPKFWAERKMLSGTRRVPASALRHWWLKPI